MRTPIYYFPAKAFRAPRRRRRPRAPVFPGPVAETETPVDKIDSAETGTPVDKIDFLDSEYALKRLLEDLQAREWWSVAAGVCKLIDGLHDAMNLYENERSSGYEKPLRE
jgi:hypothetical protein